MKQFFKIMFASMLGTILVSIITLFVFFSIIISIAAMGKKDAPVLKEKTVLTMTLDKPFQDRTDDNPFSSLSSFSFNLEPTLGLNDLLKTIEKAKTDSRIEGIVMNLSSIPAGWATLVEVRKALEDFKTSGKFIYTYAEIMDQKAYYIASVSDKIFMNSEGNLELGGLASAVVFYKNALEKLGVDVQVVRHGKFKSAVEPFLLDKMSAENRAQIKTYLDAMWGTVLMDISKNRNLTVDRLNEIADSYLGWMPQQALENQLIDGLISYNEMEKMIKDRLKIEHTEKYENIEIEGYAKVPAQPAKKNITKDKIAVIYAAGDIVSGEGDPSSMGSIPITKALREAAEDENVKAIVLRVNSPGGSALASEVIYNDVMLAKEKKPVVASFGDYAASGGYYIACGADKIIANPNTLTGSIGVFGVIPNIQKLLNEKLGLNVDVEKTNRNADFMAMYRPLSSEEKAIVLLTIERTYNCFITHVAQGRKMNVADVDSIGQGRVWAGLDAKRIGLVDELGGLNDAIAQAAKLAAVEDYKVVEYPKHKNLSEQLIEGLGQVKSSLVKNEMGEYYNIYKTVKTISEKRDVQARLPFVIMD